MANGDVELQHIRDRWLDEADPVETMSTIFKNVNICRNFACFVVFCMFSVYLCIKMLLLNDNRMWTFPSLTSHSFLVYHLNMFPGKYTMSETVLSNKSSHSHFLIRDLFWLDRPDHVPAVCTLWWLRELWLQSVSISMYKVISVICYYYHYNACFPGMHTSHRQGTLVLSPQEIRYYEAVLFMCV